MIVRVCSTSPNDSLESSLPQIDLDEVCPIYELPKLMCSGNHPGCVGSVEARPKPHSFDEPIVELLPITRPIRGMAITWYPHEKGSKRLLQENAGHVHIALGFGREHVKRIIDECRIVYLITCAPTMLHRLESNLDLLENTGIGAQSMRTRRF